MPAIVAVPVPTCGEGGRQTPLTHLHLPLQDQKRMEKISKRTNAIEEVNNNVKLLTEMVTSYSKGETTESSEDLMKVRAGAAPESLPSVSHTRVR